MQKNAKKIAIFLKIAKNRGCDLPEGQNTGNLYYLEQPSIDAMFHIYALVLVNKKNLQC